MVSTEFAILSHFLGIFRTKFCMASVISFLIALYNTKNYIIFRLPVQFRFFIIPHTSYKASRASCGHMDWTLPLSTERGKVQQLGAMEL